MARRGDYPLENTWKIVARELGLEPQDILRRAELPEDLVHQEDVRLTMSEYFRFWRAVAGLVEDPLLPLKVGANLPVEAFQPPLFAALCSPNYAQAISRLATYKRLVCPMVMSTRHEGDRLEVTVDWSDAPEDPPHSFVAMELVFVVQLGRTGARARIEPLEVHSTAPLEPVEAYRAFFGVAPQVGPHNRLVFAAADAARPFLTSNNAMWKVFEPELRRRLAELDARARTADRVRAALLEMLPGGQSGMDTIARRLGMSKRTMQRRLQVEATSYQAVLNQTREDLARHYLQATTLPYAEISFLLGFGDPNSFFRAFSDWTGSTPESMRQGSMH